MGLGWVIASAKWGSVATSVVIGTGWALSEWRWAEWYHDDPRGVLIIDAINGNVSVFKESRSPFPSCMIFCGLNGNDKEGLTTGKSAGVEAAAPDSWWLVFTTSPDGDRFVSIPLWLPMLIAVAPVCLSMATAWVRRARALRNEACTKCGYDRRGLPADAKCPECGAPPVTSSTASPR